MITTVKKYNRTNRIQYKGEEMFVYRHDDQTDEVLISPDPKFIRAIDLIWVSVEDISPARKVGVTINQFSETRAKENKIYLTLRKVFLENHPNCEANLPGCSKQSTTVHHSAGRMGKRLIDVTSFVALCGSCHTFCELNPDWAKENGYSLIRL